MKECRSPCKETKFDAKISSKQYPTKNARSLPWYNVSLDDNIVKLKISYDSLDTTLIDSEEYYFIENLLGDIGGQLGLWSGFSLMTVFELVFFIGNIIYLFVHSSTRLCRKRNKCQDQQQQKEQQHHQMKRKQKSNEEMINERSHCYHGNKQINEQTKMEDKCENILVLRKRYAFF